MTMPTYKSLIDDKFLADLKVRSELDKRVSKEDIILGLILEIEGLKDYIKLIEKKASSGF